MELSNVKQSAKCHQTSMRKLASKKSFFRGRPVGKKFTGLVARRRVMGQLILPPGGRRFGRKEEKKKGRKKERKYGILEDLKKDEVFYTP